ncbi:MAG TPA: M1 family metallopeptidase [Gemmatimonadaceae bacterium]|nr:M1 family metallopeptidase [Gemmatimonadaceae bacterium]
MTPPNLSSITRAAVLPALVVLGSCQTAAPATARPGTTSTMQPAAPERVIRRHIPMTDAIRRALAAGSRDSSGRPAPRYWQLRTDYVIEARLDTATSRLTGRERVVIRNDSPDSLTSIRLRLDPNIFLGNTPKAAPWVPAEVTDGMVITRLAVNGQVANLEGAGNQQQRVTVPTVFGIRTTNARIALPTAIPAGASATLDVEWNHKLPGGPGVGHRMTQRWADTLYQPTQWYPRVAVYDDLRGWDTELYLGPSEFYNNFGRFDVRLDVPAGWIVTGTGLLQNPQEVLTATARARLAQVLQSDAITTIVGPEEIGPGAATAKGANGRLVWHFRADSVNDFAWATAKKFVWQATRATIPGKGTVPIHMAYLPGRANLFADAGQITRHALEFYSRNWFPYEFPQLTLQDGPSSGMEYPMVINSNRGAADHETFHQWAPMVVSNNETWYGWMDEGFNQYANILSDADAEGKPAVLDRIGQDYGRLVAGTEAEAPMMWNANYGGPMYGFMTYSKLPMVLSSLGGIVGDSAVQQAIRDYGTAWKYRHPSPWDFMFSMNRSLGRDLGWFWYYWLFSTASVDGSIRSVSTSGARSVVTVHQAGDMPSPVVLEVKLAAPATRTMDNAVMRDATTAVITWPVDVWFGGSRTFDALVDLGAPVQSVTLDPGARFPDREPADNTWPRAGGG